VFAIGCRNFVSSKFSIDKLKHTYGDEKLLKQLNVNAIKYIKIDSTTNKITYITKKVPMIDLNMEYKTQDKLIKYCKYTIKEIEKNKQNINDNNDINTLTNCANGKFHEWVYKNNDLICSICNQSYNSLVKTLNETTEDPQNGSTNIVSSVICCSIIGNNNFNSVFLLPIHPRGIVSCFDII
jgi:hypothetical protein